MPSLLASVAASYAKTKTQISFAVTAKLISAFVFATRIVQFLFYLNPKYQVSNHRLWLYSPVCVGPGRKPRKPVFSQRGPYDVAGRCSCSERLLCVLLSRISQKLASLQRGSNQGKFKDCPGDKSQPSSTKCFIETSWESKILNISQHQEKHITQTCPCNISRL